MPVLKNHIAFKIARRMTAFLNLDLGVVRGAPPNSEADARERERLEAALRRARERISVLEEGRAASGIAAKPENITWVFGNVRTGSTWLGRMMGDMPRSAMWNEPRVGELFGHFFYEVAAHRRENRNFIMSSSRKPVWTKSVRDFVLDAAAFQYPRLARDGHLVIKEPSGSIGAPVIMEALPESRMVLLVRDPRDVVASSLDATGEGGWTRKLKGERKRHEAAGRDAPPERDSESLVKQFARTYVIHLGNAKRAYESHEGPKTLVRYEDLRSNTMGEMKRIYAELGVEVGGEELSRVVEKHSWENIPEEEKGRGKFARKGMAGGWREDLTAEQARMVEDITAPLLEAFYPEETGR